MKRLPLYFLIFAITISAWLISAVKPVNAALGTQASTLSDSVGKFVALSDTNRPVLVVNAYAVDTGRVAAGEQFELAVELLNKGSAQAYNVIISYDGGTSLYLQGSGGTDFIQNIANGDKFTSKQNFLGALELAWTDIATVKVGVSYSDSVGTAYSDSFTINLNSAGGGVVYATATPATANKPQLVVTNYKTDVDLLQPGTSFGLSLDVRNMGNSDANAVTMVLGGGVTPSGSGSGTPQPGGVSGSGGDLTVFAPLNSSNLVYIGNLKKDATTSLSQKLIVNVTAQPGVYTLKISFVYTDEKGNQVVDDQVITLLVYSLPQVDVNFYRDPGVFTAGTMNVLPIQVTNLGKKASVLGNMKVTAEGAEVTNNVSLVGSLDPGGYYTLDANIFPANEGSLDVVVIINYTDDFNQPRTVEKKIKIDVVAASVMPAGGVTLGPDGKPVTTMPVETAPETFWQKIGRFFKGLFGLDSSQPKGESTPTEVLPSNGGKPGSNPVIIKGG